MKQIYTEQQIDFKLASKAHRRRFLELDGAMRPCINRFIPRHVTELVIMNTCWYVMNTLRPTRMLQKEIYEPRE